MPDLTDHSDAYTVGFHPRWREAISRAWPRLSLAAPESPSAENLEMFWRRSAGAKEAEIARDFSYYRSEVQRVLRRTGVALIWDHLGQGPHWLASLEGGATLEDIARLAQTRPELVDVALHGWPAADQIPLAALERGTRAWRSGATRAATAQAFGISEYRFEDLRSHDRLLLPRRWRSADLEAHFGWSSASLSRYRSADRLPPPDGHDLGAWWWPSTICAWAEEAGLTWCRACGRAFVEDRGLRAHNTWLHTS